MNIKNPFSLYDFLGYFFPGAFILILIIIMMDYYNPNGVNCSMGLIDSYKEAVDVFMNKQYKNNVDLVRVWFSFIVFAYVLGHIISYFSSITVEYFTIESFQYPSRYLLAKKDRYGDDYVERYWRGYNIKFVPCVLKFITLIILLPVSFWFCPCLPFGKCISGFICKPLDKYLINCIEAKLFRLPAHLNVERPPISLQIDIHRIVMHYVYINYPSCRVKVDNYIALYGFLRSITLILCVVTDFIMIDILRHYGICQFSNFILLIIVFVMSFVCYLAFFKFYRRFTLENYMTLLVGKSDDDYYIKNKDFEFSNK